MFDGDYDIKNAIMVSIELVKNGMFTYAEVLESVPSKYKDLFIKKYKESTQK